MKIVLTLLAVVVILASLGQCGRAYRDIAPADRYPGPWQTDTVPGLLAALGSAQVRGCGHLRWRASAMHDGEYLVECSRDGTHWHGYLVWPRGGTVHGPFDPPELSAP